MQIHDEIQRFFKCLIDDTGEYYFHREKATRGDSMSTASSLYYQLSDDDKRIVDTQILSGKLPIGLFLNQDRGFLVTAAIRNGLAGYRIQSTRIPGAGSLPSGACTTSASRAAMEVVPALSSLVTTGEPEARNSEKPIPNSACFPAKLTEENSASTLRILLFCGVGLISVFLIIAFSFGFEGEETPVAAMTSDQFVSREEFNELKAELSQIQGASVQNSLQNLNPEEAIQLGETLDLVTTHLIKQKNELDRISAELETAVKEYTKLSIEQIEKEKNKSITQIHKTASDEFINTLSSSVKERVYQSINDEDLDMILTKLRPILIKIIDSEEFRKHIQHSLVAALSTQDLAAKVSYYTDNHPKFFVIRSLEFQSREQYERNHRFGE